MGLIPIPILPQQIIDCMTPESKKEYRNHLSSMAGYARNPFFKKVPEHPILKFKDDVVSKKESA